MCDILYWYYVLETFFQQDIYTFDLKINILLTNMFVGNTLNANLTTSKHASVPIRHKLQLVILGYGQNQATAIMGTRCGQD